MSTELDSFLEAWRDDPLGAKPAFLEYRQFLETQPGLEFDFIARPGVSYSLRAKNPAKNNRITALVDVVDDEPENRWLSVCFYADMVQDPEERGDFVPQGLLGEDALCFNLDEDDSAMRAYIGARLVDAAKSARS